MQSKVIGGICGLLAIAILLIPDKAAPPTPPTPEPAVDLVAKSFDSYEDLWRKHALKAAEKIESGELTTDTEVWEFLAAGQEPARKVAFDELARKEQEYFNKAGGWSAELHGKLLRSYAK